MSDDLDVLDAPADNAAGADKGVGDKATPADSGKTTGDQQARSQVDDTSSGDGEVAEKPAPKSRSRGGKAAKAPADAKPADEAGKGKAAPTDDDGLGFGEEDEDGSPKSPATWPDDWREKLAGGNEKLAKRLSRMA